MTNSLQPGLRDPWAACESARRELLSVLGAVPADGWFTQDASGRWSVAQQASHLLLAEIGTSKIARRIIRGDFQEITRPDGVTLHDSTLAVYPFGKVAAPAFLEPGALAAEEAVVQLAAAHSRFFEELQRYRGDDPDALSAPDPASDFWFTLAGWVRVQALHEAHHVAQIRRVLAV